MTWGSLQGDLEQPTDGIVNLFIATFDKLSGASPKLLGHHSVGYGTEVRSVSGKNFPFTLFAVQAASRSARLRASLPHTIRIWAFPMIRLLLT